MIAKISRKDFELLTAEKVMNAVYEPLILNYKQRVVAQSGADQSKVKEEFYKQLNKGQRALFVFQAYHNHANKSFEEFYWWSAYFVAQPSNWLAIKAALRFFQDDTMLSILEKLEDELKKHNHPTTLTDFTITREDLYHNQEFLSAITPLHDLFEEHSPTTIKKIMKYIQRNLQEFVEWEDHTL